MQVGLSAGVQPHSPVRIGWSFEAGVLHHWLTRCFHYGFDDGRTATDAVDYQPWLIFFRAGFVLGIGPYRRPPG